MHEFFKLFDIQPSAEFIRQAETLAQVAAAGEGITYLRNDGEGRVAWVRGKLPADIPVFMGCAQWHPDGYDASASKTEAWCEVFLAGPSPAVEGDSVANAKMTGWKHSLMYTPRRGVRTRPRKKTRKA